MEGVFHRETAVVSHVPNAELKRRKASLSQDSARDLVRITEEDLTTEGEPSEGYWKTLAEKRRVALDESLKENQELHEKVTDLEEELNISRAMLDESRNLVEVLTEIIQEKDDAPSDDTNGDSSNDGNDVSLAEEAKEAKTQNEHGEGGSKSTD